ncbi:DNA gyrase subunit A [Candidatus Legionella polyplacis]|uniref:DNA gyrase subunit A n=1 Tax=Candidatus Legionella polyplacis TaxID=2005262 RepID=UPI000C1F4022|nr:DNA gyrase subunit A [Candidatus Legionella polyplacis]ATW01670.1 DNA gyrase subunit A [Candidatus Legionella polyplacis]
MISLAKEITLINVEDELKKSYLDYAMSVIIGRALPNIYDGLKPVHRRILFAMKELNNDWDKPYKKSARIVGDVIGKYHPHGDMAVYDAIVRMAQSFSMRYMLIDGQGNFGSVDGDLAAAMRYTEIRMSKFSHYLLNDLEKDTVDFIPNYDESEFVPSVLPTKIPNLLVNGSSGIAVGMATNIPPHNLTEVINGCIAVINNPEISIDSLIKIIPGPDFPTSAIINGKEGILNAYRTGKGRILIRARTEIETNNQGNNSIIVTELPYQVNKSKIIEKISELIKEKRIGGISGLRDESNKQGMRIVIELKKGEKPEIILNNLYSYTQMQNVFGINMVALVNNRPCLVNLKQIIEEFLKHRKEIIIRRTIFDLNKTKHRAHILTGLSVSLENINDIIDLIKKSQTSEEAKKNLLHRSWNVKIIKDLFKKSEKDFFDINNFQVNTNSLLKNNKYKFSTKQTESILKLTLQRLTKLEQKNIVDELESLLIKIKNFLSILNNSDLINKIIYQELVEIKNEFGDLRKTEIISSQEELNYEDLITKEDIVVTLSHQGYVKYQPLSIYQSQKRGGKGKLATNVKEEDFIERLLIAKTHDNLLCFSNYGKLYWLKAYQLPLSSRISRGKPINNILPLDQNEVINAILPVQKYKKGYFIFMVTKLSILKKVPIEAFSRPRSSGIIAIDLSHGDRLVGVDITDNNRDIMLFSDAGKVVRFNERLIRPTGRTAKGVKGIKLKENQSVISLVVLKKEGTILTATENGYGKRTNIEEYPKSGKSSQGVISIRVNQRNGKVVRSLQVKENDEIMLITNKGTLVRFKVNEISIIKRNTQGVRLINLGLGEYLVGMQRIEEIQ